MTPSLDNVRAAAGLLQRLVNVRAMTSAEIAEHNEWRALAKEVIAEIRSGQDTPGLLLALFSQAASWGGGQSIALVQVLESELKGGAQ